MSRLSDCFVPFEGAVSEDHLRASSGDSAYRLETYTKLTGVGKGTRQRASSCNPRVAKPNNLLVACTEDKGAKDILEGVRTLRQPVGQEGVKAFVIPMEAVT